eukprot:205659-Prorocentrum_minimum.AAC.1
MHSTLPVGKYVEFGRTKKVEFRSPATDPGNPAEERAVSYGARRRSGFSSEVRTLRSRATLRLVSVTFGYFRLLSVIFRSLVARKVATRPSDGV